MVYEIKMFAYSMYIYLQHFPLQVRAWRGEAPEATGRTTVHRGGASERPGVTTREEGNKLGLRCQTPQKVRKQGCRLMMGADKKRKENWLQTDTLCGFTLDITQPYELIVKLSVL